MDVDCCKGQKANETTTNQHVDVVKLSAAAIDVKYTCTLVETNTHNERTLSVQNPENDEKHVNEYVCADESVAHGRSDATIEAVVDLQHGNPTRQHHSERPVKAP